MLINGIDLSSLGVQLYNRVMTSNQVDSVVDWNAGDIQPTYVRQQDKFKNIQLQFLILEQNEDNAFMTMSKLTSMLKKASIIFDDIDLIFDVTIRGASKQERLKNGNFILTVNLKSDYAKGETEVYTTDSVLTNYFKLHILYYQDGNKLITTDEKIIKETDFTDEVILLRDLGIDIDKYKPDYYNSGFVSNLRSLDYQSLYEVQNLIINYAPTTYYKDVEFFIQSDNGVYDLISESRISFTKAQVDNARNLGELIDFNMYRPDGYAASTNFRNDFTFDNLMAFSPLGIYFSQVEGEQSKEITITYYQEGDNNTYDLIGATTVAVRQTDVVLGSTLKKFINVNRMKPEKYYNDGFIESYDMNENISFNDLQSSYTVNYPLIENSVYVEYYYGEYPDWNRITMNTYHFKYSPSYNNSENIISDLGINLDRYYSETYQHGVIRNNTTFTSFDDVVEVGIIQVYYKAKDYELAVEYLNDENEILQSETILINETMFLNEPPLATIIELNKARPEGYIYDLEKSYSGAVTLGTLLANAPIRIYYKPVEQIRTKSIIIRYKQELASAYSTINTSIITIEESQVGGGCKLTDLFNINAYRPDYYNAGIIDGYSSSTVFTFDELQGEYSVLYLASSYSTQVRYYTDEIANENWIGSETLQYTVLDFSTDTTLIDLGLNVNAFKPTYCGNGEVQYTGPVNFSALRNLDAVNVIYISQAEPEDPSGINYPHRILYLQHNDMGNYEKDYTAWTLNHAYINTGVTCDDMSKLTVLVDTFRVFETEPLYNVNVNDAYLFGSVTPSGSYYIKYVNNTRFKNTSELTGVNTFNVAAGYGTPELVVEETSSEGFSSNTGISASTRDGYSYGTLTFTHLVQSNTARMQVPLYLFACDMNGYYRGGIAGVGIKSCKIYYDDVLIRDFVPVAFFDKIGDKVAPSNCLYDKVTQTFFEDATAKNSFNIMDDPDYEDTDPEHNIGCCYANYYAGDALFNASTIWFRESDFVNGNTWDPYEKLFVDYYQPEYYMPGQITNLSSLGGITFNNVKNYIFNIRYDVSEYQITVNYWSGEQDTGVLLGTDVISLTEKDFYSVPTFGQLVDLFKYKPAQYKVNFEYPEEKVTLRRVLSHSPYNIVYTKVDNPRNYTTKVEYYRKHYTIDSLLFTATWTKIGEETIVIDETEFGDGIYPEKFINFDAYYPDSGIAGVPFYAPGEAYEWYKEDDILFTPEDLRPVYKITYDTVEVPIEIRYYTDEVDEANLIATNTWQIKLSDWPDGEQFQIVDELPNKYIDAYKPIICWGGRLVEPEKWYTFQSLAEIGHIDIAYETKEEPHDPDNSDFPQKVLWWTKTSDINWQHEPIIFTGQDHGADDLFFVNIYNPYIDLGYTPKEIQRLKTEMKVYALNNYSGAGSIGVSNYSYTTDAFSGIFGYESGASYEEIAGLSLNATAQTYLLTIPSVTASYGQYTVKGHSPTSGSYSYHDRAPVSFDGHIGWRKDVTHGEGFDYNFDIETVRELTSQFRRGKQSILDIELNPYTLYYVYGVQDKIGEGTYILETLVDPNFQTPSVYNPTVFPGRTPNFDLAWLYVSKSWRQQLKEKGILVEDLPAEAIRNYINQGYITRWPAIAFNPLTHVLDAWNDYSESYDYETSNRPYIDNLINKDRDIFEYRGKPKGSLLLWNTRNPEKGTINWLPSNSYVYLVGGYGGPLGMHTNDYGNPYTGSLSQGVSQTTQVITGTTENGTPIYENRTTRVSFNIHGFTIPGCSVPFRSILWYLKIWDRNKLVRDLIPVAEGDQIYNFIAPANGLYDKQTEIFFTNNNEGGNYAIAQYDATHHRFNGYRTKEVLAAEVAPLQCDLDPTIYGKIVVNYFDKDNKFIDNQYVVIPVHYNEANETLADILHLNDFKPNDFYRDGMIDVDEELYEINDYLDEVTSGKTQYEAEKEDFILEEIYLNGAVNIYYKLKTYTKTVVYYQGDKRVGSKDIFYNLDDINDAETLEDLGIDLDLYASDDYKPGVIRFNENILKEDDIAAFIDAPSPIVIYEEYSKEERPDLLYVNFYRGGAYDENLITLSEDPNYFDCELTGKVMNPNGIIKYSNHYHSALYEDEEQDYFIPYQVELTARYVDIHKGPGRAYMVLANITDEGGRYTAIQQQRNWIRLKEYPKGWINLAYTKEIIGPGQHPSYESDPSSVTIPYATHIEITKMTVDRLWGYLPAEAAWVKMDEISLDQTGKLYNALATQVIHLDQIEDWSTISSLEDLGINKDQWLMRFHELTPFNYEDEYNYNALSAAHKFEIVYPETIYNYNCYYYDRTLGNLEPQEYYLPGSFLPSSSSSSSRIYYTSIYKSLESTATGPDGTYNYYTSGKILSDKIWHPVAEEYVYYIGLLGDDGIITPKGYAKATILESSRFYIYPGILIPYYNKPNGSNDFELGRVNFSCSISDWNPDWPTFISTSWLVDEDGLPIDPTLYRDTEIKLTWDFFGVERNKFKPNDSYEDGLYLWSPRTWENEDSHFTFKELITTGTQQVIYLPTIDRYKLVLDLASIKLNNLDDTFKTARDTMGVGHTDLEIKFSNWFGSKGSLCNWTCHKTYGFLMSNNLSVPYSPKTHSSGYYDVINISDKRNATFVSGYGKIGETKNPTQYQVYDKTNKTKVDIIDSLNLQKADFDLLVGNKSDSDKLNYLNFTAATNYDSRTPSFSLGETVRTVTPVSLPMVIFHVKQWNQFHLIHYLIPVPKGYYLPNGTRVTENTLYDVITGDIMPLQSIHYEVMTSWGGGLSGNPPSYHTEYYLDGKPYIFKETEPITSLSYDFFHSWSDYNSEDSVMYGQVIKRTKDSNKPVYQTGGYKDPDPLAVQLQSYYELLYLPIIKTAEEQLDKGIVGKWYQLSNKTWVRSSDISIAVKVNESNKPELVDINLAYKHPNQINKQYSYTGDLSPDPSNIIKSPNAIITTDTIYHASAKQGNYYFIGNCWLHKNYTQLNSEQISTQYSVVVQSDYYSVPILDNAYRLGRLLEGDRVTAILRLNPDPDWIYLDGKGWMYSKEAVSEIY